MSNALAESFLDLGVDVRQVYARCVEMPSEYGSAFEGIPSFTQLFEEYSDIFFTKHCEIPGSEIAALREEFTDEVFDVERGFIPEVFGLSRKDQLRHALMYHGLMFVDEGRIYNQIIVGVW